MQKVLEISSLFRLWFFLRNVVTRYFATCYHTISGEDKNILQVIQQYIVVDFEPIAALKKHIIVYNASMAFARLDAADTSPASPREAGFFCLFPQ